MAIWLAILAVVCYLFFFIDGKELTAIMRQGGWAALVFYCLIAVFIVAALSGSPETAQHAAPAVHH